VTVSVTGYWVSVEGQHLPGLFCLLTDLTDIVQYPAAEPAARYKWRWHGPGTALRETKGEPGRRRTDAPLP
jgi:hypothetical protein